MKRLYRNLARLWTIVLLLNMCWTIEAAELTVKLVDPPETGTAVFMLFDSANSFGDLRTPAKSITQPLDNRIEYLLDEIPPGDYALLVYYDENDNGRIDKNFIGIPTEPLGFSNRYRPKGPPSYSRAVFSLAEGETRHFDVKLDYPLGKRGRWGVGAGIIARSTPYRDYSGNVYQVIPAVTYTGDRLQMYGPELIYGLIGKGKVRLAATGRYRIGAYEEDESPFLAGMGDRKNTLMAGLAVQAELPGGLDLSMSYEHDALNRIGGGSTQLKVDKSFQAGIVRFSPYASANWLSSELAMHDFGVPAKKAKPGRKAYGIDDTVSLEAGMGVFVEITRNWLFVSSFGIEFLDNEVTGSPIVEDDYVMKGFTAVSFVF